VGPQEFAGNPVSAHKGDQGRPRHSAVARTKNAGYQHSRSTDGWHVLSGRQESVLEVHNPENTVVIELKDERYNELIIEVADPKAAVELVKAALPF
jgi:hypothetical protein